MLQKSWVFTAKITLKRLKETQTTLKNRFVKYPNPTETLVFNLKEKQNFSDSFKNFS